MYTDKSRTTIPEKEVMQTMSFQERETKDVDKANLSILCEEDLNVFRETIEDQKHEFKMENNTNNTEHGFMEDFSNKTKYPNEDVNLIKCLEMNMNLSNRIEDLTKNIKMGSKVTDSRARLEKDKTQRNVTSRSANTLFLLLRIVKSLPKLVNQWMVICVLISCVCAKEQRFAIEPQDQVSFKILNIVKYQIS